MSKRKFEQEEIEETIQSELHEYYEWTKNADKVLAMKWLSRADITEKAVICTVGRSEMIKKSNLGDAGGSYLYFPGSGSFKKSDYRQLKQAISPFVDTPESFLSYNNTFFEAPHLFVTYITPLIRTDEEIPAVYDCKVEFFVVEEQVREILRLTYTNFHFHKQSFIDFHETIFHRRNQYYSAQIIIPSNSQYEEFSFDEEDNFKNFKLDLWSSQKRNLTWMQQMERKEGITMVEPAEKKEFSINGTCLILTTKGLQIGGVMDLSFVINDVGVICDPTGSGKSIIVIAHLYRNLNSPPLSNLSKPDFFVSPASVIVCHKLLVTQWHEYFKNCLGSMLVGPRDKKETKSGQLRLLVVKSVLDIKNCTIKTLTDKVDVVLLNRELFSSKTYNDNRPAIYFNHQMTSEVSSKQNYKKENMTRTRNYVKNRITDGNDTDKIPCIFEYVWWNRVIMDECHEIHKSRTNQSLIKKSMCSFYGDFYWGLSATPGKFSSIKKLFHLNYFNKKDPTHLIDFTQNCTIKSNKINFNVSHIEHKLTFSRAESFIYETKVRSDLGNNNLLQFCCHHSEDSEIKTVDEVIEDTRRNNLVQITKKEKYIEKEKKKIESTKEEIVSYFEKVDLTEFPYDQIPDAQKLDKIQTYSNDDSKFYLEVIRVASGLINDLKLSTQDESVQEPEFILWLHGLMSLKKKLSSLLSMKDNLNSEISKHAKLVSNSTFFETTLKILATDDRLECPICYDEIDTTQIIPLLPCGHIFDEVCINNWLATSRTCPHCRSAVNQSEIISISRMPKTHNPSVYGSKIDSIVKLINEIVMDESRGKIIIYAQWDSLIKKISSALKESDIDNEMIRGSVHSCKNSISRFKEPNSGCNILMLSSDGQLSGLDLPEVSDIIFAHPLNFGEDEHVVFGNQQQAIGRTLRIGQVHHVKVHHMIVKDTLEEELFKKQMEYASSQKDFINVPI